jgi:23S rRNA pseudouridine955/2504/2580 synthase
LQLETNTFKPSFGYRLDKDTSGVLIAAKTYNALQYINKIIRDRKIDKFYMTIVAGIFPQKFESNKALEKTYNQNTDKAEVKVSEKR